MTKLFELKYAFAEHKKLNFNALPFHVSQGGWNTVCIRGCTPELEEGDECIDVSSASDDAPPPVTAIVPKMETSPFKKDIVDPEVSIFDLYRTDYSDDDFSDDLDSADEEGAAQHF